MQAAPLSVHAPASLHTCACLPVQRVAVGLHAVHAPALHDVAEQSVPFTQLPVASHVCATSELGRQRLAVGLHSPVHTPALHSPGQSAAVCHLPALSHTRGVVPTHSFAPGLHSPVHTPAVQRLGHGGPLLPTLPVSSQSVGCSPVHFFAPGLQSLQAPPMHAVRQAVLLFQVPVASQVCGTLPVHCVAPGAHVPVQAPPEQTKGQAVPVLA